MRLPCWWPRRQKRPRKRVKWPQLLEQTIVGACHAILRLGKVNLGFSISFPKLRCWWVARFKKCNGRNAGKASGHTAMNRLKLWRSVWLSSVHLFGTHQMWLLYDERNELMQQKNHKGFQFVEGYPKFWCHTSMVVQGSHSRKLNDHHGHRWTSSHTLSAVQIEKCCALRKSHAWSAHFSSWFFL